MGHKVTKAVIATGAAQLGRAWNFNCVQRKSLSPLLPGRGEEEEEEEEVKPDF